MENLKISLLFALVAFLILITGFVQSWNTALLILNMGLISAIMSLGVNLQWGFAGLFNVGIMGFVALGGLATVLVSAPPGGAETKTVAKPPNATNPIIPTLKSCLLYTSPSPRDGLLSRMPSSA